MLHAQPDQETATAVGTPLKVLYVTSWVLGDPGANAADIFPRLAARHDAVSHVIVADFPKNRFHIQTRQGAEYLRLEWRRPWVLHAARIARKAKQDGIDVIHVFYRQQNAVLVMLLRGFLHLFGAHARILVDHRSVNLAKGWRRRRKMAVNALMQRAVHHLAGNPWAVETNHKHIRRPRHVIDLGYDRLPALPQRGCDTDCTHVWFIGTLRPRNRKSEFLLDIFDALAARLADPGTKHRVIVHVAGPATDAQARRLRSNRLVRFYGKLPRMELYERMQMNTGLGLAYMNAEFHSHAPSLKFAEYAVMRFGILASDTVGLMTQARRMGLKGTRFLAEDPNLWADAIVEHAAGDGAAAPIWHNAVHWSYSAIFDRQVIPLYQDLAREARARGQGLHRAGDIAPEVRQR